MSKYFKLPLKWIGVTTFFSGEHLGNDFGCNKDLGGSSPNVFAINDGIVIENGYNDSTGYRIWIQTDIDGYRYLHRYCHLKEKSFLIIGQKVSRGDVVGIMGSTGDTTGIHLHLDLWKCPSSYELNFADRKKYSVDPLKYCFLFDDQEVSISSKPYITFIVGSGIMTLRNILKNQVSVLNKYLRARNGASLNSKILGYIDLGIYNYNDTCDSDGYTWYKLDNDLWIAGTDDVQILPIRLHKFIALKSDYYYIYLKEKESVYYD